jgi:hypothetical protein
MLSKSADQKKLIWTSLIQLVPAQSHLYIQYCIYESWVIRKNKRLPAGLPQPSDGFTMAESSRNAGGCQLFSLILESTLATVEGTKR